MSRLAGGDAVVSGVEAGRLRITGSIPTGAKRNININTINLAKIAYGSYAYSESRLYLLPKVPYLIYRILNLLSRFFLWLGRGHSSPAYCRRHKPHLTVRPVTQLRRVRSLLRKEAKVSSHSQPTRDPA